MNDIVQSTRSHISLLVMFLFVWVVFGLLAYRSEMQSQRMADNTYTMCTARNVNVARLNHFYRGMIAIEQRNPFKNTSPSTITRRIALYRGALLNHVDCGKDPR